MKWDIRKVNYELDWYEGDPEGRLAKILEMKIREMGEAGWEPWAIVTSCVPITKGIKEFHSVWYKRPNQ